jgi:hypothetical protein
MGANSETVAVKTLKGWLLREGHGIWCAVMLLYCYVVVVVVVL